MELQKSTFNPIYMGSKIDYKGDALEMTVGPKGQIVNKVMTDHQKQFGERIIEVTPGVHVSVGRGLGNCTMVEGKDGLIIIDTDSSVEAAQEILAEFRKISDKPVKAIIYTHYHYVGGTLGFINMEDYADTEIWAHEYHIKNIMSTFGDISDGFFRRLHIYHGSFLDLEGEDGFAGEGLGPYYKNPKYDNLTFGYLPPNRLIENVDKTEAEICGVKFEFYPAPSETDDSMIIWLPEYGVAVDNHAWPAFASLYSLRGTEFRHPMNWVKGIDIMRKLKPEHLCSVHGIPVEGKEKIYEILTDYRDAIQYLYDSVVIGFNGGKSAEEIIADIEIPRRLCWGHLNKELYGEIDFYIRAIYDGLIGWFGNDVTECHRLTPIFEARKMVEAFGGEEKALELAQEALDKDEYIWAAQVSGYIYRANEENEEAKKVKIQALRMIARITPASGTRTFYMTQVLTMEGKRNPLEFKEKPSKEVIRTLPYDTFVRMLRFKMDQRKLWNIDKVVTFKFTDIEKSCSLHIRKGVVEYLDETDRTDVKLTMTFDTFSELIQGESLSGKVESGAIVVEGDCQTCDEVIALLA